MRGARPARLGRTDRATDGLAIRRDSGHETLAPRGGPRRLSRLAPPRHLWATAMPDDHVNRIVGYLRRLEEADREAERNGASAHVVVVCALMCLLILIVAALGAG